MKISWAAAGLFLLVLVLATTSALPKCPHCALSGSEKKPCSHCSRLAKAQQVHKPYSAASHDLKYKQTYGDSIATYGAGSSLYDASNLNYGSQVYEAANLLHGTANTGTSSSSGSAYNIGTASSYGNYNAVGQPAAENNGYISQSNCDQYNSVGQSEALQMLNGYGFGSSVGDKFKLDSDVNFGSRSRSYAQAASSYPTSAMNLTPSSSYSNAISSANAQSSAYSAPMNSALSTSYSQAASPAYLGSATLPYQGASVNQAPASHLYSTSNLPTYTSSAYGNVAPSVNPGLPASSYSNAAATAYSASYSAAPSINSIPDISSLYPDSIPAPTAPLSFSNAASTAYSQSAASAYPPYSNSANTARSPYAPESLYSELSPYSSSTSSSNLAPFSSVQTDCNDSLLKSKYSTKQSVDSYLTTAEYPALASADYTSPAIVYSKPMSAEPHAVPSLAHLASSQGFSSPNEDQPCKSGPTEQEEPNVSMSLVCKNVMAPKMAPPKKYVAEDRLAFGHRQHPADARNQMENPDIPEEKLLTVDKPIFDPNVPCKCKTSLKQNQQETDGANDQSLESYVSYKDHRCNTVALNQPQYNENDGSLLSIPLGPTIPYTYRIADENMNHQSTRDYNDNADSANGGSCAFKTNIIERIRNLAMHKLYKRV